MSDKKEPFRLDDRVKEIIKKGTYFTDKFWIATKREGEETKIAILIIRKMIQNKPVTYGEKEFIREHSIDLAKIIPLVFISGLPIPIPLTPLLIYLAKRYNFDIFPKDNRHLLDKKEKE
jgi:hypothetical protein